ncbi:MAG: GAF domain-containing protein [Endomicrobiia bacterium]|nr:GAF domain-containing protein [Endomicrobiia bacterium]
MKGDKVGHRRKYVEHLSSAKKDSVAKIARDSLAIETLGELAVYSAALPYQSFVAVTLAKIMSLMGAATGSVFKYDDNAKRVSIVLWQGMETDDIEAFASQSVSEGVPGLAANCILQRSPILVENPLLDPLLATAYFRKTVEKYGLTSAIALPLVKEARVFGSMVLFTSGEDKFNEDDVAFLRAVSLPIVSAFEAHEHVAEINRERAKLWNILESLSIGVLFLDDAGRIVNFNKIALSMMRMEEGMIEGKSVEQILFPHLLNAKNGPAYSRFADVPYDATEEVTYIAPSYNRKSPPPPIRCNAKFTKIDGGTVFVFSDTCRERGFFASQAALAEAAVKYVRQPVRNLMESMSVVAIAGDLNSRQYENLLNAQNLAEKMWHNLRLVEKSVEYATGRLRPAKDSVDIDDILQKACARCADKAQAKGIRVEAQAGDGVLYGDSIMIAETIDIVLSEVVDSAQAGSVLRLSAEYSEGKLKVEVSSDKPSRAKISNPLAIQYLRNFFAYIKGDIDFNPAAEAATITPVVSFVIPS